jgi:hypothetical protein
VAGDDPPTAASAHDLLAAAAPDLLVHGAGEDPPGAHPWGAAENRSRPRPWESATDGDPIRGRIHGALRTRPAATPMEVGAPVPRSRPGLRLAVRGRIHGIWGGGRWRYAREGGEQGREGAGGRGRLEREEDVVKICLTSGVQCDKGVYL